MQVLHNAKKLSQTQLVNRHQTSVGANTINTHTHISGEETMEISGSRDESLIQNYTNPTGINDMEEAKYQSH